MKFQRTDRGRELNVSGTFQEFSKRSQILPAKSVGTDAKTVDSKWKSIPIDHILFYTARMLFVVNDYLKRHRGGFN